MEDYASCLEKVPGLSFVGNLGLVRSHKSTKVLANNVYRYLLGYKKATNLLK